MTQKSARHHLTTYVQRIATGTTMDRNGNGRQPRAL